MEESIGRSKWQTTRGQAAHLLETELDTDKKRHVITEAKEGKQTRVPWKGEEDAQTQSIAEVCRV